MRIKANEKEVFSSQGGIALVNTWHQGPTVEMSLYIHMNMIYDS